jgi:glycosyltransferase involved in cell wall biosynthesis
VLATADGEVVAWHCERSGGGLLFSDGDELVSLLQKLSEDPSEARAMAERGRRYVVEQYSWEAVLDRMEQSVWELG